MDPQAFRSEKHECELPPKEDVLSLYISDGHWVSIRRCFRKLLLMSETDLRSKMMFKSAYVMRAEKVSHLKNNYYMIHPFSCLMYTWEHIKILTFLTSLLVSPAYLLSGNLSEYILALDIVCLFNLLFEMNTGYVDYITSTVILGRKRVFCYRLRTWFFIDLISCCNYNVLVIIFGKDRVGYLYFLRYCIYVRVLRMITILTFIEELRMRRQGSMFKYHLIRLIIVFLIMIFWATSIMYEILNIDEIILNDSTAKEYYFLFCLRTSVKIFLSYGIVDTKDVNIIICQIFGLYLGFMMQMVIVAQIVQMTFNNNYSRQRYYEMSKQISQFMHHKCLPHNIRHRIMAYLNFRFQQNYYNEDVILNQFPLSLKHEAMLHNHMYLLENVEIFAELPVTLLYKIISLMKTEIYLASDIIISGNAFGECMLFIASGTAAVYTSAGKEIAHLSDGQNFGELTLITDIEHRLGFIVAIEVCEVLILLKRDFKKQIDKHLDICEKIKKIGQEKMKKSLFRGDDSSDKISMHSNAQSSLTRTFLII